MTAARGRHRSALLATALALAGVACTYGPNPKSGTLKCGAGDSCPQDYRCLDGACWKNGEMPGGMAGMGGGGNGGNVSGFVGHWVFDTGATRTVSNCSQSGVAAATGDYFELSEISNTSLTTFYYCDWTLTVASGGNSTAIEPNQSCTRDDMHGGQYTWFGEQFTFMLLTNGHGSLQASLPYDDKVNGNTTSCKMQITGTLTKQ